MIMGGRVLEIGCLTYLEPKWCPLFWLEFGPSIGGLKVWSPKIEDKQVPGRFIYIFFLISHPFGSVGGDIPSQVLVGWTWEATKIQGSNKGCTSRDGKFSWNTTNLKWWYCWWPKSGQPVEVGSLSHYLQGFVHPRWCRISAINSRNRNIASRMIRMMIGNHPSLIFPKNDFHTSRLWFSRHCIR